ncbi:hypothetical protein CU100_24215 [Phyllobacterium endophyticum]|uniref:Uncharacterized protein n=1 Tax=Phyllobacterium endophyticum TaxID=1149773 RepID=A0A2P7ALW3_9HYPH|nr:hypothetical protein CU100_24215 [Phyllobacterium endophyticum]
MNKVAKRQNWQALRAKLESLWFPYPSFIDAVSNSYGARVHSLDDQRPCPSFGRAASFAQMQEFHQWT